MLDHDTAVMKLCLNISDNRIDDRKDEGNRKKEAEDWLYDPAALSSCVQLLPGDWSSEDKTILCANVNSSSHAEAVVCRLHI
jgi:hypothetical protein